MSLNKLTIKGFQKWKKLVLELGQITVLVGDNEVGKSAVVRALKWLIYNVWDGKAGEFINWDMESCEVKLEKDGHVVTRFKDKSNNLYTLDEEEYKAFGTKVPLPVAKTLNMTPDNFQEQLDLPFWLTLNNSQAATALNQIFDLEIIDTTVSNVSKEVRESKTRVTLCKERLDKQLQTKKELDWIVEANQELKIIESLFLEIEGLKEQQAESDILFHQIEEAQGLEKEIEGQILLLENLIKVGERIIDLQRESIAAKARIILYEEIERLSISVESKTKTLNKYLSNQCPLCGRSGDVND